MVYDPPSSSTRASVTVDFHSFAAFGSMSKERLFLVDSFKWTPTGFPTWVFEKDQSPGMVNVRRNRIYAREIAAKLIKGKRQELKGGTSRKDLLSLLGSFPIP